MSTHYTAGGMPLAFTEEDFLVLIKFNFELTVFEITMFELTVFELTMPNL